MLVRKFVRLYVYNIFTPKISRIYFLRLLIIVPTSFFFFVAFYYTDNKIFFTRLVDPVLQFLRSSGVTVITIHVYPPPPAVVYVTYAWRFLRAKKFSHCCDCENIWKKEYKIKSSSSVSNLLLMRWPVNAHTVVNCS